MGFFQLTPPPSNAMGGSYNLYLVALSYIVAVMTSYVALQIATLIRKRKGNERTTALIAGGCSMGAGIFSMHFVGMLAFIMPMPMGYAFPLTLLSLIVAIVASGFAMFIICKPVVSFIRLISGGIVCGLAIAGMHYIGMGSMTGVTISYLPGLFFLSLLIAIVASIAAMWIMLQCDWVPQNRQVLFKFVSALVMGAAICGMHYTGMFAAVFLPAATTTIIPDAYILSPEKLSFLIAGAAAWIMFIALYVVGRSYSIFLKLILGYLMIVLMIVPLAFTAFESITSITSTFNMVTKSKEFTSFIEKQSQWEQSRMKLLQMQVQQYKKQTVLLTAVVIAITAILAPLLSLFIAYRISKPIIKLRDAYKDVAKGNLQKRVSVESEDEIGQLANSFNIMVKELEDANKRRDQFVGMAAHDLRIPVSVIIEGSGLLSSEVFGPLNSKQKHLNDMTSRAGTSMMSLLNELLAVNIVQSKTIHIEKKEVPLHEFVENIYNFNLLLAEKKKINLKLTYSDGESHAFFDETKIAQVINNFVSNALKFSESHSEVDLLVKREGKDLRVEVKDTAAGIPLEEQDKVFTWFAKISVKPTNGEASHGLGLAICKEIIDAHGGQIGFRSTPGKGSTFFFTIEAFKE